jgi:hypothetical protein
MKTLTITLLQKNEINTTTTAVLKKFHLFGKIYVCRCYNDVNKDSDSSTDVISTFYEKVYLQEIYIQQTFIPDSIVLALDKNLYVYLAEKIDKDHIVPCSNKDLTRLLD